MRGYAKINTGLDVLRRREDGYHEVRMVLQTVDIFDDIRIRKTEGMDAKIALNVNRNNLPSNSDNLMVKAAVLIMKEYGITQNLHLDLKKNIPMAAGMAGGSADAAATLVGVNQLFSLGLSTKRLQELGLRLGADIPFCIQGGTYLAEGIGEKLTRLLDFLPVHIVIVKPKDSVSTKYVYENLHVNAIKEHPDIDGILQGLHQGRLDVIAKSMSNILEQVTAKELPMIEKIKETMRKLGAIGSNMSGSGPSVFGLFEHEKAAKDCARYFKEHENEWEGSDVYLTKTFDKGVVLQSYS